jgi:hypothetical protein
MTLSGRQREPNARRPTHRNAGSGWDAWRWPGWRGWNGWPRQSDHGSADDGQAPPFVVRQPHSLISQLRLQDAILCAQEQDNFALFVLEPAEKRRDEQLQRNHSAESTPTARRCFRTLRALPRFARSCLHSPSWGRAAPRLARHERDRVQAEEPLPNSSAGQLSVQSGASAIIPRPRPSSPTSCPDTDRGMPLQS